MKYMTSKELKRYYDEMDKFKVQCKCSHKVLIPYDKEYEICHWCGNRVYRDKEKQERHEFKNEVRSRL